MDPVTATRAGTRADTRAVIVEAAAALLEDGGPAAVTTRGVAERAGVQAPTIYRLFGDKDGLLDAVAEHVMAAFVAAKAVRAAAAVEADTDPVEDLVASWHRQVEFGVGNPAVFRLLSDPARTLDSPAARIGRQILESRIHRVARAGRLRVPESAAIDLVQAAGVGTIQVLLATPVEERDAALAGAMLDAVLARIVTDAPAAADPAPVAAVVTLRALAPQLDRLSAAERGLLVEWLDRATDARPTPGGGPA